MYSTDFAAVGDCAEFDLNKDGTGVITSIDERKNHLSRKLPKVRGASYRGERLEQVVAANMDNVFVVSSVRNPKFNNRTIDRFLVAAESSQLNAQIIINKSDLDKANICDHWAELYNSCGYNVFVTSAVDGSGIDELKKELIGFKNLFWGQSGVGKSSLLNVIFPQLKLKIGEISKVHSKGTHTTVTSVMIPVENSTFIIDTPGVKEIDPYGIRKEDVGYYFKEFGSFLNECKFNTCTHHHEPSCKIKDAVERGDITEARYDSYIRIIDTIEDDINF